MSSFAGIVLAPCGVYLAAAHPAWSDGYLFDPDGLTGFVAIVGGLLPVATLFGGYVGGARLVRRKGVPALRIAAVAGVALLGLVALLAHGRIWHEGNYIAFHRGDASPLQRTKLLYELLVIGVGTSTGAVLVARTLRGESRRKQVEGAAQRRR